MSKKWDCPACGKPFYSKRSTAQHIKDVHGEATVDPRRRKLPPPKPEREMSLADISVEAHLKVAMGMPLDELEQSLWDSNN
jgi:hypothetical protein